MLIPLFQLGPRKKVSDRFLKERDSQASQRRLLGEGWAAKLKIPGRAW